MVTVLDWLLETTLILLYKYKDDILYYISKYIKTILIVVGSITAIISAFFLFTFTSHKIASNSEYEYLVNNGFINKYSAGEYELNIYRPGNPESKYKIIGLSDINENNFAQRMEQVNKQLMDYDLIYIDRAGYGYSDDTDVPQTVEQVVNDYRTALKSAGINPPYVLMPHEYGGIFAAYWIGTYPDEIKGFISIEGEPLGGFYPLPESKEWAGSRWRKTFAAKVGLHRSSLSDYSYESLPGAYSMEAMKATDYLNMNAPYSKAQASEDELALENSVLARDTLKTTDIPKIYISTTYNCETTEELKKQMGSNHSEDALQILLLSYQRYNSTAINPHIKVMGNMEVIYLPCEDLMSEKPDAMYRTIKNYLDRLG